MSEVNQEYPKNFEFSGRVFELFVTDSNGEPHYYHEVYSPFDNTCPVGDIVAVYTPSEKKITFYNKGLNADLGGIDFDLIDQRDIIVKATDDFDMKLLFTLEFDHEKDGYFTIKEVKGLGKSYKLHDESRYIIDFPSPKVTISEKNNIVPFNR